MFGHYQLEKAATLKSIEVCYLLKAAAVIKLPNMIATP